MNRISQAITESIAVKNMILNDENLLFSIEKAIEVCVAAFKNGNKALFCGNGGSAADAQHLSAELSGRFYFDRPPLNSEALHVNTSFMTAVANDYSYDEVFARMVRALGKTGDVLIGLSTSGNSSNVIRAFEAAKEIGMTCIAFTGAHGGKMRDIAHILINVPSNDTPRIQESHIMIGHILCEHVESRIFGHLKK